MTLGSVNDRHEAIVPITLITRSGSSADIAAVVDTGFTGFLALPPKVAASHGLATLLPGTVKLGDGSRKVVQYFQAEVVWNGQTRTVRVLGAGTECVLGVSLLKDMRLEVTFRPGETVTIAQG